MSDLFRIVNFDEEPDGPQEQASPTPAPSNGLASFFRPSPPVEPQPQPPQPAPVPVATPAMPTTPAVVRSEDTFARPVYLQPVIESPTTRIQAAGGSPTNAQLRALLDECERRVAARERIEENMREIIFSMGRELCFPAINEAQRQSLSRFESMTIAELARFITKATLIRMSRVIELEARNEQWAIAYPLHQEQVRAGDQRELALRQENAVLKAALAELNPLHPLLEGWVGVAVKQPGTTAAPTWAPAPPPVPPPPAVTIASATVAPAIAPVNAPRQSTPIEPAPATPIVSATTVPAATPVVSGAEIAPERPLVVSTHSESAPPVVSADKRDQQPAASPKDATPGAPASGAAQGEDEIDVSYDGALSGGTPLDSDFEGADHVVRFLATSGESRSTNIRDAIGKLLNVPQKSGQVSRALETAALLHFMNRVKVKRDFPQSPRAFLYLTPEGLAHAEKLGVKPIPTDLAQLAEHYKDGALVAIILAVRDILVLEGFTNIRLAPEVRTGTGLVHRPQLAARFNGQEIFIEVIRDLPIRESDDSRWLRAAQIGQGMLHVFAPNNAAQTRVVTAINIARDAHPDHIQRFNAANVKDYHRRLRGKDGSVWMYARF